MKKFNKALYSLTWMSIIFSLGCISETPTSTGISDYPINPVEFTKVSITDGFWRSRLDTVSKVTIPYTFAKCEETGRVNNFIFAGGISEGKFKGVFGFDDSDVYKIVEGASYSLMNKADPDLKKYLDNLIGYISAAQEDDGYLYTAWTLKANDYTDMVCCSYSEEGKFLNSRSSHELYNAGHMYEAAVAHYQATGERNFLDVAIKNADLIYKLCVEQGQQFYPGHQEIELGLVKLYRATGEKKYLELAKLFLDRRGRTLTDNSNKSTDHHDNGVYSQDHKPVTEQSEAVGHSVRATYMYAAMADIAAITGDKEYLAAIDRIWNNVVSKKLYITGGLGAGNGIEGFDVDYALPNDAYAETCAAIANVYWNHRMFLLHGDSKYMDILERTLYNGLIVGLSMDGDKFFYPNPLEFDGERKFNQGAVCRSAWFDCSCCPSNLSRFVPSVSGYVYASTDKDVYVNLFMENVSDIPVNGKILRLNQKTDYPWSGDIILEVENSDEAIRTNFKIRIPGWVLNEAVPSDLYSFMDAPKEVVSIKVNDKSVDFAVEQGYAVIPGIWKKGDKIEVHFPMEVKGIKSHENIVDNKGKTAIQRGPLLYCAEGMDNQGHALDIGIQGTNSFEAEYRSDMLNGVTVLNGKGSIGDKEIPVRLIPYYSWSHREISPMTTWLKNIN